MGRQRSSLEPTGHGRSQGYSRWHSRLGRGPTSRAPHWHRLPGSRRVQPSADEDDCDFLSVEYKKDRLPGDLGFDPLGLATGANADIIGLHNVEINSGRLAMIGITSFLVREFIAKDL